MIYLFLFIFLAGGIAMVIGSNFTSDKDKESALKTGGKIIIIISVVVVLIGLIIVLTLRQMFAGWE
jgi:hypothetical protein